VPGWWRSARTFGQLLPAPAPVLEALNFRDLLGGDHGPVCDDIQALARRVHHLAGRVARRRPSTSLLFTVGKFLIGLYLGKSSIASLRGGGSLVIIVVWVYYSLRSPINFCNFLFYHFSIFIIILYI
jgi:hypothetical protein